MILKPIGVVAAFLAGNFERILNRNLMRCACLPILLNIFGNPMYLEESFDIRLYFIHEFIE